MDGWIYSIFYVPFYAYYLLHLHTAFLEVAHSLELLEVLLVCTFNEKREQRERERERWENGIMGLCVVVVVAVVATKWCRRENSHSRELAILTPSLASSVIKWNLTVLLAKGRVLWRERTQEKCSNHLFLSLSLKKHTRVGLLFFPLTFAKHVKGFWPVVSSLLGVPLRAGMQSDARCTHIIHSLTHTHTLTQFSYTH
jgi:hypothetical protein